MPPLTPRERDCAYALSVIFLDTQLDEWRLHGTARQLVETGMIILDIETLLWDDFYPVLIWNVVAPSGECFNFDRDAVR
jgi:hypothetical protein